jgi:hypothetical protein
MERKMTGSFELQADLLRAEMKRIARCAEVALGQGSLSQKHALQEISKIALRAIFGVAPVELPTASLDIPLEGHCGQS